MLQLLALAAIVGVTPTSQPGALDLYPPTKQGHFTVRVDHFRFALPVKRFGLRFAAYEKFAQKSSGPVLFYVRTPLFEA